MPKIVKTELQLTRVIIGIQENRCFSFPAKILLLKLELDRSR